MRAGRGPGGSSCSSRRASGSPATAHLPPRRRPRSGRSSCRFRRPTQPEVFSRHRPSRRSHAGTSRHQRMLAAAAPDRTAPKPAPTQEQSAPADADLVASAAAAPARSRRRTRTPISKYAVHGGKLLADIKRRNHPPDSAQYRLQHPHGEVRVRFVLSRNGEPGTVSAGALLRISDPRCGGCEGRRLPALPAHAREGLCRGEAAYFPRDHRIFAR